MPQVYDARGNIYAVATPAEIRQRGIPLPVSAEQAARTRQDWAPHAIDAICHRGQRDNSAGAKAHSTDGLLVGPFGDTSPFDVLIVNTDGTLAERSGNGLTIFAQCLADAGLTPASGKFIAHVHHDKSDMPSPVATDIEPAVFKRDQGFWLSLGPPQFGPAAVNAGATASLAPAPFNGRTLNRVAPLASIDAAWTSSQFVRIGNPHCVTLLTDADALPGFAQLHEGALYNRLEKIAFSVASGKGHGDPCAAGINLQWAAPAGPQRLMARVFERGEGPTASSGTSASAVACAAWLAGLVAPGIVEVVMPGGTAPVRLDGDDEGVTVHLFGMARPSTSF